MERKANRNLSVARGSAVDTKKDGPNARQWPRGTRRREPPGSAPPTKSEPSRKPQPQKIKALDKRPKSRGNGCPLDKNELARVEYVDEAELGSVFVPGSKKQSLNHLLNFNYYTPKGNERWRDGGSKGAKLSLATKKHKYNKEHFLQANCQFIVNESGDYRQYVNNPDALVDWNLIEQVNLQVSECPSCPICLYPPIAAKITKCGHIYCWSCILHYLSLSDKSGRKCPICFDNVQRNELKSVVAIPHPTFNITETITFKLMKRLKGSLIAYPADAEDTEEEGVIFLSKKETEKLYSKLLLAKREDVLAIIEREQRELQFQIDTEENCPEKCFLEQALVLLKERESDVLSFQGIDKVEEVRQVSNNAEDVTAIDSPTSKYHYFYQASDGQHIYLHALNVRMLEHSYGSLENSPKMITGVILEKEGGSMTEELRKRLRYLQHLPVTCQFEVAEIALRQPAVNKETLEFFKDQIDVRKKRRYKRAKEEKRREKRIEAEELRKMGKYPIPDLHLESNEQFPEFQRFRTESESTQRSSSPEPIGASSLESTSAGPSFAKMLAMEKKQVPSWPSLKPAPKAAVVEVPKDDPDDFGPVPAFNTSLSDALAIALAQIEEEEEEQEEDPQRFGKKKYFKKQKKKQKKVLFATTIAYSGN